MRYPGGMPLFSVIPLFFILTSCEPHAPKAGVTCVWAADESEKVRRGDLDHRAEHSPLNTVWNGKEIALVAARNEVVGVQVILEAEGAGADRVAVSMDSLVCGSSVLKNRQESDDLFDFVGRRIEMFLAGYIPIDERSEWWIASARPLPDAMHRGLIPDPLVPAELRGSFEHGPGGMPFRIPGGMTQAIWIDISVPPDAPAGRYTGAVVVTEFDSTTFTIPVSLDVLDLTLPDTTHLHNHVFWGWPTVPERHGPELDSQEYWTIFHSYAKFFHRHRLDLTDGVRKLDDFRRNLAGYYTGEFYTTAYGYEGPGQGVGNQTYSIGTYDQPSDGYRSGFYPDTREAWQAAADSWESWFQDHAPPVLRFKYMEDEPPHVRWPEVREKGLWIRTSAGAGRDLDVQVTTRIGEELFGAITLWMLGGHAGWPDSGGTSGYDVHVVRTRKAAGEKVGFYNGQRPSTADPYAIDNFATDPRVNPWIAWKYDTDLYFLWEIAYYASSDVNIWAEPWGGTLVYTGEDRKYPRDSRGLKGPIASIRLKNIRRGIQDYEYLWLARQAGVPVDDIVNTIVPAAFNDYNGTTFTCQADQPLWASEGHRFEQAKREIAHRLLAAKQGKGR